MNNDVWSLIKWFTENFNSCMTASLVKNLGKSHSSPKIYIFAKPHLIPHISTSWLSKGCLFWVCLGKSDRNYGNRLHSTYFHNHHQVLWVPVWVISVPYNAGCLQMSILSGWLWEAHLHELSAHHCLHTFITLVDKTKDKPSTVGMVSKG